MPAPTVNAYYDPSLNSMNYPSGIVQPPFFDPHFPVTRTRGRYSAAS
jgi:predicted metalloendopeptidase